MAEGAASAIATGLERIAAAAARSALTYRDTVAAQRKARAMLRSEGGLVEAPSVARQHRAVLAGVSRTVHILKQGERADISEDVQERLAHRREIGLWRGISL
jgi:hypothetical protein